MRFTIENLGFKSYCSYSDKELAKAYVVYSIQCERALNTQELDILYHDALKFTLRKNRLYIARIWQQGKYIYYSDENLSNFCDVYNGICNFFGYYYNAICGIAHFDNIKIESSDTIVINIIATDEEA